MPDGFIPSLSAFVDSSKRTMQQRLGDMLSNPLLYLRQTVGQANDQAKVFIDTNNAATLGDPIANNAMLASMLNLATNGIGVGQVKKISTVEALANAIKNGEGQFVRWSRGPAMDARKGFSRDYVSGSNHEGLSAVKIDPEWATDPQWMGRRVGEYGFLRMKDPKIAPYIYSGKEVGLDSDGYSLIKDISGVARINPSLLDDLNKDLYK